MKKILSFGILGAIGCLLGAVAGELVLVGAGSEKPAPNQEQSATTASIVTRTPAPPPLSAAPAPPPPPAFAKALERAGAHTGDIQLSLQWFNRNDIDLHCIDPQGFRIFFGANRSPSGGWLDVDRNVSPPTRESLTTDPPVENIFWPERGAPAGRYQVFVNHYRHHGDADPTPYNVSVKIGYQRTEYTGKSITHGDTQPIVTFNWPPPPRLRLSVPPEVVLNSGESNTFGIRIARDYYAGPVTIKLQGDLADITCPEAALSADKDEGEMRVEAGKAAKGGRRTIRVIAVGTDDTKTEQSLDIVVQGASLIALQFAWSQVLIIGLWTALLATGLSLALVAGQNRYLQRPLLSLSQARLVVIGALSAGFIAGAAGQLLFGFLVQLTQKEFISSVARFLGWVILGALLGGGMGFFLPNLRGKRAAIAGGVGGFLGALFFEGVGPFLGDLSSRWVGALILGLCIGLMVAIVEAVFREAWLEVNFGRNEARNISLGPEPVSLGSDRHCTVYASGSSPTALRYTLEKGQVICEDVAAGKKQAVSPGDHRSVGALQVTVRVPRTGHQRAPAVIAPRHSYTLVLAGGRSIPLAIGRRLTMADLPGVQAIANDGVVAEVITNQADPTMNGLKNLSQVTWSASMADGKKCQVGKGLSIRLIAGVKLNFGQLSAEIK